MGGADDILTNRDIVQQSCSGCREDRPHGWDRCCDGINDRCEVRMTLVGAASIGFGGDLIVRASSVLTEAALIAVRDGMLGRLSEDESKLDALSHRLSNCPGRLIIVLDGCDRFVLRVG